MGCLTAKASGSIASFITPTVTPIESARVYFSPTQLGEGTPSPENVREIVGRTSVELKQCRKNLFDGEVLNARFKDGTVGEPIQTESTGSWRISKNRIEVKGGSKLYCYTKYGELVNSTNRPWIVQTDENDNYISFTSSYTPSLILDTNTKYIRFQITSTVWNNYNPYFFTTTPLQIKTIPFSWKRLPDEYQEVEYIENTGTQYLLTDLIFRKDLENPKIEWKHMQIAQPTGDNMLFGYTASGGNVYFEYYLGVERGYSGIGGIRYADIHYPSSLGLNEIAICSIDKEKLILNGVEFNPNKTYTDLTTVNPMSIFAWTRTNGTSSEHINKGARIYYLRFYNGDKLLGNFIPCYRKSDNEIGMYDTVSQTFYTNQGTGTFLKGDDVFTDEVYGGYVDLVKGEIVETWIKRDLSEMSTIQAPNESSAEPWNHRFMIEHWNSENQAWEKVSGRTNFIFDCINNNIQAKTNYTAVGIDNSPIVYIYDDTITTVEEFKAKYNAHYICYQSKFPITHQLPDYLKTQLQTLKNENTFWSDADSVEIEYGLAETFDIQKAKRKIIMNQPHVETLTGDAVSFTTDMKAPLKECKVSFMPVQEGSGDPSPTNVRNITGWNGVSVKNGENTYSIDWTDDAGTIYGGYVDLVSGELVDEYYSVPYTAWSVYKQNNGYICYKTVQPDHLGDWYCNVLNTYGSFSSNAMNKNIIQKHGSTLDSTGTLYMALDENVDISTVQVIYKRAISAPITYQLTPEQILSLKGINNFSCGIKNDMTVKYWKHKLSDSANIAYEAENLTFNGTNYIDTGVYLFSEKNINRDFEVVIEDLYGSTTSTNTIVCAKYNSTAIGFLIRLYSFKDTTFNGTIFMKSNNHNNITIKRVNGVITIDGEVIINPTVQFTNAVHNHPLVLGCALQDNGTPFRYATGTIGHITVKWL